MHVPFPARLLLPFLPVLLLAGAARASEPVGPAATGRLSGVVGTSDGGVLPHVAVTLTGPGGPVVVTTGPEGAFGAAGLAAGEWTAAVDAPGLEPRDEAHARVVEGGDAACKLLVGPGAERIDAVVLDLVMPDLDGLGVLARMRDANVTVPVIVQTAHGGIDNVVSAMRAGATDFVVKPASAERL